MHNNNSDYIFLKGWRPYLLIAGLAFLVYSQAVFFGLTYFDDHILVLGNQGFLRDWANFLVNFKRSALNPFGGGGGGYYRPFGIVLNFWDAHLSGINPVAYHLTNILLHCAVSCLLFNIFNKLNNPGSDPTLRTGSDPGLSLFLALLFAAHPISVPAVAWITGRVETFLAFFILLSFYFFLAGRRFFLLHLFFFLCALFSKELALVFPLVLAAYIFLTRRGKALAPARWLVPYMAGWAICGLIFISASRAVVGSVTLGMPVKDIFWSVAKNSPGIFLYIGKIFLPINLAVLPVLKDSNLLIGIICAAFLSGLLIWLSVYAKMAAKGAPKPDFGLIAFGLAWFFIFLIPTFISPDLGNFLGFLEQRAYLPMIGLLFMFQEIIIWVEALRNRPFLNRASAPFLITIIILFSLTAVTHSLNYRGRLVFWKKAAADSPHSPLARRNLGAMFYLDGNLAEARKEFEAALILNPREPMVHNNLALILSSAGKLEEAEREYQEELKLNPLYDDAHYNYGLLKYREGKKEEALMFWERTVQLNPGYADAWRGLLKLAYEDNDQQKAREYLERARKIGLNL